MADAVDRDLDRLAPRFAAAVRAALAELNARGIDAVVYEARRSETLQQQYYRRGVTRAKSVAGSWHGYGLAVDIISKKRGWAVWPWRAKDGSLQGGDPVWYGPVLRAFKRHGCDWGGDWKSFFDAPHFQWGKCRSSPSSVSRKLFAEGRPEAVWPLVDAT
jgi:hypothetical protein